jgi:hypothetical protein
VYAGALLGRNPSEPQCASHLVDVRAGVGVQLPLRGRVRAPRAAVQMRFMIHRGQPFPLRRTTAPQPPHPARFALVSRVGLTLGTRMH